MTLQCDKVQWRVGYSFLHRVVDADALMHDVIELGAMPVPELHR